MSDGPRRFNSSIKLVFSVGQFETITVTPSWDITQLPGESDADFEARVCKHIEEDTRLACKEARHMYNERREFMRTGNELPPLLGEPVRHVPVS